MSDYKRRQTAIAWLRKDRLTEGRARDYVFTIYDPEHGTGAIVNIAHANAEETKFALAQEFVTVADAEDWCREWLEKVVAYQPFSFADFFK